MEGFELIVVGAGIVGLAHALAAARRGLRVAVVERDARANGASVRNFGFVTVSGQREGDTRRRALRSREVWEEIAPAAGIAIVQRGALVVARREEAAAVLAEFAAGVMGAGCRMLGADEARGLIPRLCGDVAGALSSPHELRIEARDALPRLARWLAEALGVRFFWDTAVLGVERGFVRHAGGALSGGAIVVAPGSAAAAFAPGIAARIGLRHCKLQMMRLAAAPGFRLPGVVMSDLSLARYEGFAAQPSAARLRQRLESECSRQLAHGVHLIVAQGADGSLVVGDSHHYGDSLDAFASEAIDELILGELRALFDIPAAATERWVGHYPVAQVQPLVSETIGPRIRLVAVTSGTGMSTAFAIGEETVASLFG